MPQAIGDPDALERFAQSLGHFIDTLNTATNGLNQEFNALGETWQDEKRARFEDEYNLLLHQMASFEEIASEHIPYLLTLASRLRDYLQS
jgi:uncharacterized protein YukE